MEESDDLQALLDAIPRWKPPVSDPVSPLTRLATFLGRDNLTRAQKDLNLTPIETMVLTHHPEFSARPSQLFPINDPNVRVIWASCGRGWGKGWASSCTIVREALEDPEARIAILAPNLPAAKKTNIWGPSGVLALCPPWFQPEINKSDRVLTFPNGATLHWLSGADPEKLRGGQFSLLILDELVAIPDGVVVDTLREAFTTLRHVTPRMTELGIPARLVIASTPKPSTAFLELLRRKEEGMVIIEGSTLENKRLDKANRRMAKRLKNTGMGRLEYEGKLSFGMLGKPVFASVDWDRTRKSEARDDYERIVVMWDPATGDTTSTKSKRRDKHGICVVGLYQDDRELYHADILASMGVDVSVAPDVVAKQIIDLAEAWQDSSEDVSIMAERNAGGSLVKTVFKQHGTEIPVRTFRTKEGKTDRAWKVQPLAEAGFIHLTGRQKTLEKQIKSFRPGGSKNIAADDVLDAMLLALEKTIVRHSAGQLAANDNEEADDSEAA